MSLLVLARAVAVGTLAGVLGAAFRVALGVVSRLRDHLLARAHVDVLWSAMAVGLLALATAGGVWLARRFAPEAVGSGIQHVEAVLQGRLTFDWRRLLPVKFASGVLCIGSGLALGREGPTVQMGAAVSRLVAGPEGETGHVLLAAGAGAGLAAAFNAPLGGVVFVVEELRHRFEPAMLAAAAVACVCAGVVVPALLGAAPPLAVTSVLPPSLAELPWFVALGMLAGAAGTAYNRAILGGLAAFDRLDHLPAGARGALAGAGVGLVGCLWPAIVGGGEILAVQTIDGGIGLAVLPLMLAVRVVLSVTSYGCGAPGGLFAPLLVIGAQLGVLVGLAARGWMGAMVPAPAALGLVGMAAFFTAIVRAPLTGIVLVAEMTGVHGMTLPLLAGSAAAYVVANALGSVPIYSSLLERQERRQPAARATMTTSPRPS